MKHINTKVKSTDTNLKQTIMKIESKEKENLDDTNKESSTDNGATTRKLPNWLKRAPSEHDIKNNVISANKSSTDKEKIKKKPKINL